MWLPVAHRLTGIPLETFAGKQQGFCFSGGVVGQRVMERIYSDIRCEKNNVNIHECERDGDHMSPFKDLFHKST